MSVLVDDLKAQLVDPTAFKAFVSQRRPDRILKILGVFTAELNEKVEGLSEVLTSRDIEALRSLTHSMLGSASMIGALKLVEKSRTIENACLENRRIEWSSVDELKTIASDTVALFQGFLTTNDVDNFISSYSN